MYKLFIMLLSLLFRRRAHTHAHICVNVSVCVCVCGCWALMTFDYAIIARVSGFFFIYVLPLISLDGFNLLIESRKQYFFPFGAFLLNLLPKCCRCCYFYWPFAWLMCVMDILKNFCFLSTSTKCQMCCNPRRKVAWKF